MTPAEINDKEVQGKFIYLNNLPKLKPQIPTTENTLFGKVININKWTITPKIVFQKPELVNDIDFLPVKVVEPQKYIFYLKVSDLYNSTGPAAELKDKINIHNNAVVPLDKVEHANRWDFFKTNYYNWHIEKTPFSFINLYLFFTEPFNEITVHKFLASKYMEAFEYWEEYIYLQKAWIGLEHVLGKSTFNAKYSLDEINECLECFHKYWIRQIGYYNSLSSMGQIDWYNPNMFEIETVWEELLENILYTQCQILDAYWAINFVNKLFPLNGSLDLLNLDEDQRIDLFNTIYEQYQIDIVNKLKGAYAIRREFIVERSSHSSLGDFNEAYNDLIIRHKHINFNSKFSKNNFHKKIW